MYEVDRLTFLMALVKETGNSDDFPDQSDNLFYFLEADDKSGFVQEWFGRDLDEYDTVYTFGNLF